MKRIAVFIALGSIIAGIIILFWPVECEHNPFIATCFNGLDPMFKGLFIVVLGITFLPLIAMANSRHDALALLGVLINSGFAVIAVSWSLGITNRPTGPKTIDLFISTIMAVQGVSFFCARLSAILSRNPS